MVSPVDPLFGHPLGRKGPPLASPTALEPHPLYDPVSVGIGGVLRREGCNDISLESGFYDA